MVNQSKFYKYTFRLKDNFVDGVRDRFSIKEAYIILESMKVLDTNCGLAAIDLTFFYEDLENPNYGGTSQTIDICQKINMPFLARKEWTAMGLKTIGK